MNKTKYICTYFDYNYLPRGLALYQSIKKYHEDFTFFILTFDDKAYEYLLNLNESNIKLINHQTYKDFFNTSPEKFDDKKQYYFSTTPNLCLYLINNYPEIDILLYLDSDVYIFNSIDALYVDLGDFSIGLTQHRVNPLLRSITKHYGSFNVGVNLFRNSIDGLQCLKDWKNDCDTWYPDKPGYPLKFFSDQIFLDDWPDRYENLKIIENPGVNAAYWNIGNYKLTKSENVYLIDSLPLMIFHFSNLKKVGLNIWNTNSVYGLVSIKGILKDIFVKYINHIESFGLDNQTRANLTHKENYEKRIIHFLLSRVYQEVLIVDNLVEVPKRIQND